MKQFFSWRMLWTVLFMSSAMPAPLLSAISRFAPQAQAQESPKGPITGEYLVSDVKRLDLGGFEVFFKKVSPTSQFNELKLVSTNIHVGLKPGLVVRLAAEYLGAPQKSVELSQVLVYLPGAGTTYVPVWLMSSKIPQNGLTASKFLEMHAPSMDYQVF